MNQYQFAQYVTVAMTLLSILYVFLIRWPQRKRPSLLVQRIAWFNQNSKAVQDHFAPKR